MNDSENKSIWSTEIDLLRGFEDQHLEYTNICLDYVFNQLEYIENAYLNHSSVPSLTNAIPKPTRKSLKLDRLLSCITKRSFFNPEFSMYKPFGETWYHFKE